MCGSASLGGEIASLRLLAPFFGSSTIVWANTIAVVLLALSLGYYLGGRLADRHPHLRGLCSMIGVAALLYAIVPIVASPFLRVSVKLVDASSFGTLAGSLISVIVLVALPMTLLGAVSPWALRLALHDVDHSGRVAGRLYAISTAGSLLGIMLATLVLIPFAGSRRTFFVFALALALIAAFGVARGAVRRGAGRDRHRRASCRSDRYSPRRRATRSCTKVKRRSSTSASWRRSNKDVLPRAEPVERRSLDVPSRHLSHR